MDADERAEYALSRLSKRDFEVLKRFYVDGQNAAQICAEMDITIGLFQAVKWISRLLFVRAGEGKALAWVALPFCPN